MTTIERIERDGSPLLGVFRTTIDVPFPSADLAPARTIYLVGQPNRGRPTSAHVAVDSDRVESIPIVPTAYPNVVGLAFEDLISAAGFDRGSAELILISEEEPAEISFAVFGSGGPDDYAIAVAEGEGCCLSASSVVKPLKASRPASSFFVSPEDCANELNALLNECPEGPLTAARRFFASLDSSTNPTLGKVPAQFKGPVALLRAQLKAHLLDRRVLCVDCKGDCKILRPLRPKPKEPLYDAVDGMSQHMIGGMKEYLGDPRKDLTPIEHAFEQFARGELRLRLDKNKVWCTQPSSAFYFLFAEFAFLAFDAGLDADVWSGLANVLVRTQVDYCNAYMPQYPTKKPPPFGEYAACNFCKAEFNPPSRSFAISRLAERADIDDLRGMAGCNARRLFQP